METSSSNYYGERLKMDIKINIPFFSIITVCYNAEHEIEKTMNSLLMQENEDYECIIVDGKSSDKTVEIIKSYKKKFEMKKILVKIISENDQGIFDAMNKGINLATGKWINFMNAGDTFHDNTVLKKIKPFLELTKSDVVYGNCWRYNEFYSYLKIPGKIELLKKGMEIPHQASFIKAKVQKSNLFDLKYKIAGDHDLFLKLYIKKYVFQYYPETICDFSLDGVSNTCLLPAYRETFSVLIDNHILEKKKISTGIQYIIGYILRMCENILPQKVKWKIKNYIKIVKEFLRKRDNR